MTVLPLPRRRSPATPVVVAAGVLGAAAAFRVDPGLARGVPSCPVHAVTGIDCPGCGMTRATTDLLHGDVAGALGHNPLMVGVGLPLLALLWCFWLRERLTGRPAPRWAGSRQAVWVWLALVAVFTVARNLPWEPLRFLAA